MKIIEMIHEYKQFKEWKKKKHQIDFATRGILSMELGKYTYSECLLAAGTNAFIPYSEVGELAILLAARCGRGSETLERAIFSYTCRNGSQR